jgi:hypothetical protein
LTVSLILLMVCAGCASPEEAVSPYQAADNWAYLGVGEDRPVDLFFIAPTVYFGDAAAHNMSLDDVAAKEKFLGALNMERGIYEAASRMYAPYYRQIGLEVYEMAEAEAATYREIAYQDVAEAFDYYLAHYNAERPFIIAGFSQGAELGLRLLKEKCADPSVRERLVAAYLIGWRITDADLAAFPHLQMAEEERDWGVIVSFNCEAPEITTSLIVPDKTHGINPLLWTTDSELVSREWNKGAVFTDYSGAITREVPELTGCYLDPERGTLKLTDVTPEEYPPVLDIFAPGVYHIYDYLFFYRNLEENVQMRIAAYLQAHSIK